MDQDVISSEFIGTTNWLYHHDVCAQFGLKHWRREEKGRMAEVPYPGLQVTVRDNTNAMTDMVKNISTVRLSPMHR